MSTLLFLQDLLQALLQVMESGDRLQEEQVLYNKATQCLADLWRQKKVCFNVTSSTVCVILNMGSIYWVKCLCSVLCTGSYVIVQSHRLLGHISLCFAYQVIFLCALLAGSYTCLMLAGSYTYLMLAGSYTCLMLSGSYTCLMFAGSYI